MANARPVEEVEEFNPCPVGQTRVFVSSSGFST